MSGWYLNQSVTFRVKQDGKGVQQQAVDLENPDKSLEELEAKVGLKCPEDRRKELLGKLHTHTHAEVPNWLARVTVPDWYAHASAVDVTNALRWGYELVEEHKRLGETKLHDELDLKWKKVLEQTQEELNRYKADMAQTLARKDTEIETWQQTAVKNLSASGIDSKIQTLKQEWAEEQKILLAAVERERQTLTQQVEYLQHKAGQLEESRELFRSRLEQRDALLNKSVHKGDVGEEIVDTWLRTAFYGAVIDDTSKETGKMDRHIEWEGLKIIVDSKHHDGRLHSKNDVKKFYDNITQNPDAQIAILLCTNTTVPNHNRFWVETEIINENQLAVFMNNVSANPIERLQLLGGTVIQPWKEYLQLRKRMSELIAGDELKTWTDKARSVLAHGWDMIVRIQEQWTRTQTAVQTSMKDFQDMLTQETQVLRANLQDLGVDAETGTKKKGRGKKQ